MFSTIYKVTSPGVVEEFVDVVEDMDKTSDLPIFNNALSIIKSSKVVILKFCLLPSTKWTALPIEITNLQSSVTLGTLPAFAFSWACKIKPNLNVPNHRIDRVF